MKFAWVFLLSCFMLFAGADDSLAQRIHPNDIKYNRVADEAGCRALMSSPEKPGFLDEIAYGGGSVCPCAEGAWIERIIQCFTSESHGLIPKAIATLMEPSTPYGKFYNALLYGSILAALVLFGVNLIMGTFYSLPKEAFLLLIKIGAVSLVFGNFQLIYLEVIKSLGDLVNLMMGVSDGLIDMCGSGVSANIWAQWDCMFSKLTGFISLKSGSGGSVGLVGGFLIAGIIGFMTSWLFVFGVGTAIFFGIGYIVVTILLLCMRLVYSYLMAVIGISFIYLLAPIFIPMIFFGQTTKRFIVWFQLLIAYMLQPMLLVLFSIIMLIAINFAIFVGPTSLYSAIAGRTISTPMSFGDAVRTRVNSAFSGTNDWTQAIVKKPILDMSATTDPGTYTPNQNESDAINIGDGTTGIGGITVKEVVRDNTSYDKGLLVSKMDISKAKDSFNLKEGVVLEVDSNNKPVLDENGDQNKISVSAEDHWITNILLQIVSSCILLFILYNIMHAIPQMTEDLVTQRMRAFGGVTAQTMIGESFIRKGLEGSKEAARRGSETGMYDDAIKQTMSELAKSATR